MGSSVSGVMSVMRVVNLIMAGLMITLCIAAIVQSESVFKIMSEALAVIYTMYFDF
jgi:outer membrane lipoprotein-sorting protein